MAAPGLKFFSGHNRRLFFVVTTVMFVAGIQLARGQQSVTLGWNPSPTPGIAGYNVLYGTSSREYTSLVNAGPVTTATVSNLADGVTYYFVVTAYNAEQVESDPSVEISYTTSGGAPLNHPPTLNPISSIALGVNTSVQRVTLNGIGTGDPGEIQTLTVSAVSSNPNLIPNPTVSYISPNSTATLTLSPVAGGSGTATITVTVNDGQSRNNITNRSFNVTVGDVVTSTTYVEAESGALTSPMTIGTDPDASNGRYIYTPTFNQGKVSFQVYIPQTDAYVIWCRVLSRDSATDSFYVSADNGLEDIYGTAQYIWSANWQWTRVNGDTTGNPRSFSLSQGVHTITFRGREASTLLDALYITNDRNFVPASLAVTSLGGPDQGVEVSFQACAGFQFDLLASEDLVSWTPIWQSPLAAGGQTLSFVDDTQTASGKRFYRLKAR